VLNGGQTVAERPAGELDAAEVERRYLGVTF
jgi:hypothetical protein